ncbi:MAG: sugar ABC transporter permease [Rhizobiaceae bacterium]|nr:sugar ABC transporter permease [Rhizobiaceae bacterium]MBL4732039.1 sugar ABC transporter permease [Rhizobiaceae bacterium]
MSGDAPNNRQENEIKESAVIRFLRATEVDTRMLGMIGALVLIWVGFHYYGKIFNGYGAFLTPRNLWNLSVQTSSIAVMATGMVLVIVTRHIDLSVGSLLGVTAMVMGVIQVWVLPQFLGLGSPYIWIITVAAGLAFGALIGAFHGLLIAYLGIPAFIVTLGGLLVWRGSAWWVARGETIAPVDATFALIGGGPYGTVGATGSWIVGLLGCLGVVFLLVSGRKQRVRFGFPLRPVWAEWLIGAVGSALIIGAVLVMNAYPWPKGIIKRYAADNNIEIPDGGIFISHGFAIPVLIAIAVGIFMTFLTTRTRFGRYVFAIGGNPEAAELAGINTKRMTMLIFALMGGLTGISAVIASARLNSATNALGQFDELYVIAAAVIGGTSFAGGIGTIYGAMLGALVMQSLQSGMVLVGFDSAIQQIVVGCVLVTAVYIDTLYRKNST